MRLENNLTDADRFIRGLSGSYTGGAVKVVHILESTRRLSHNFSWSMVIDWGLNVPTNGEDLIYGRTNILVGKIRVQDKMLVAHLHGPSRISPGLLLFLSRISKAVHCSGTLSLLELLRSLNKSYWCRSQEGDGRKRRLSPTCLKNGEFRLLSAIEIDGKSRRVGLCLGSH